MTSAAAGPTIAVILDRDGTINIDKHYLKDPHELEFLPGAAKGLRMLHREGIEIAVVTNQSGIGRGLMTFADVESVHRRLLAMVREVGGAIRAVYYCPHHPDEGCPCRKPGVFLMRQACDELGCDPSTAFVVGDKSSDVEMGRRMGARTILVGDRQDASTQACRPDFRVPDLCQAAAIILEQVVTPRSACP